MIDRFPISCDHPKRIYNRYLGKFLFVPCRTCPQCVIRRASKWTRRLNEESKCHPYVLFGTLTYSNDFISHATYDGKQFILPDQSVYEPDFELDKASLAYLKSTGNKVFFAPARDAQLFFKRLRQKVLRDPSNTEPRECRYIRYFLVSEISETTLRPHFHFIIFTGSKWFAERSSDVVSSCWRTDSRYSDSSSFGIVHCEVVRNSASSYVASYLNCPADLPNIFTKGKFKPFSSSSKSPAIGSLLTGSEEIRSLFHSGFVSQYLVENGIVRDEQVPVSEDLYRRLYPKLKGFDKWSIDVFHRLVNWFITECFGTDAETTYRRFYDKAFLDPNCDLVSHYLRDIIVNDSDKLSAQSDLRSKLNRIIHQSRIFSVSPTQYFNRIRKFYIDLDYFRLKTQLEWEELNPSHYGLFNDLEFLQYFADKTLKRLIPVYASYDSRLDPTLVDFSVVPSFLERSQKSSLIYNDGKKKHLKADYLYHRNTEKLSLNYKNFLINLHNGFYKNNEGHS